jgi:hypothetical protein
MPLGLNIVTRIHRHMKWKEDCVRMPSLLVCSTAFPFSPLTGSCAIKDRYYTPDSVLEGGLHCSSKSDRKEHQIGEPLGSMLQLEDHTHGNTMKISFISHLSPFSSTGLPPCPPLH